MPATQQVAIPSTSFATHSILTSSGAHIGDIRKENLPKKQLELSVQREGIARYEEQERKNPTPNQPPIVLTTHTKRDSAPWKRGRNRKSDCRRGSVVQAGFRGGDAAWVGTVRPVQGTIRGVVLRCRT